MGESRKTFELDSNRNYIVSGLERSGTSMMMQMLEAGGLPVAYDSERKPDNSNPKGYYELEGGKIIQKLMEHKFPIKDYRGKFIKITSYGLQYLNGGEYTIIYMQRDLVEIMKSTDIMSKVVTWTDDKKKAMKGLDRLNKKIIKMMVDRMDMRFLLIDYNNTIRDPRGTAEMIVDFLELPDDNIYDMAKSVDRKLYRNKV